MYICSDIYCQIALLKLERQLKYIRLFIMAKAKKLSKEQQKEQQEAIEAKKVTPIKLVRLVLKSVVAATIVAGLMVLLATLGVPVLSNLWIQFAVMLVVYLVIFPYLTSEFRPKKVRKP